MGSHEDTPHTHPLLYRGMAYEHRLPCMAEGETFWSCHSSFEWYCFYKVRVQCVLPDVIGVNSWKYWVPSFGFWYFLGKVVLLKKRSFAAEVPTAEPDVEN